MASRTTLRLAAALLALAAGVLAPGGAATATTAGAGAPERVVVVGTAGMTWADVDAMPRLSVLLDEHGDDVAAGNLVVRSVHALACPVDGWLALSSGTRAAARPDGDATCTVPARTPAGQGSAVPGWQHYVDSAAHQSFDARLGSLGDLVARSGLAAAAVGDGAALALATSGGTVAGEVVVPGADDPDRLADAVRRTSGDSLTLVDVGAADAGLDDRLSAVLRAVVADDPLLARTTVVVLSLADAPTAKEASLQAAFVLGRGAGLLTSASTRTDGLVLTTDVPATIARVLALGTDDGAARAAAGEEAARRADLEVHGIGAPITVVPATGAWSSAEARAGLVDAADHAAAGYTLAAAARAVIGSLVAIGVLAVTFVAGVRRRRRGVQVAGLWLASLPVAATLSNAVPWWRAGAPALVYAVAVAVVALAVAGVATGVATSVERRGAGSRGRSRALVAPLTVAAATWLVLAVDVLRGAPWQLAGPLGTQPQLAGRFYGMNNTAFAFFAVSTLALVGGTGWALTRRRRSAAGERAAGRSARTPRVVPGALAAFGLVALAVDGLPGLGADLGGPVALVPGLAMVLLASSGVAVRARHWVITAVVAVALVGGAAVADWARGPGRRTHLGGFVQDVLDGRAGDVIGRKLEGAFGQLTSGWLAVLGSLGVLAVLWAAAAAWRRHRPELGARRNALWVWAIPVTLVVAALVNDSGPAIPALGLMLAAPLLLAWDAARDPAAG